MSGPSPGSWKKNSTDVPMMSEKASFRAPGTFRVSSRDVKNVMAWVNSWATMSRAPAKKRTFDPAMVIESGKPSP